ncbi:hypothetical protein DWX43_21895 [Clostridium sp. AF19-22AC]|nr:MULTISPECIES: hypothetical protein [Clostridia]RHR22414.1 hypothetical protein DWX43_21895 [Clostridium sp. AF19-22AC]
MSAVDKYEYKLKTEQMLELMENGAYNRAAEIADAIDWKRVRNATMLTNVSDIYEKNGDYQKSYEVLNIAYHRAEGSRKVLYRLCTLALKTGNVDEAIDYYDDFIQVAPKDPNQHILKYKILRARRAPIEQQIEALEEFKKAEYLEEWAFELAKLYQEAGMTAECLEECDDLILWFSEGKFVYKAMELKMQYKQLTPSQQERYDRRYEKLESETVEIPDLSEYQMRNEEKENTLLDREELDKEREREILRKRELGDQAPPEDSEEETPDDDDVQEEEPETAEETGPEEAAKEPEDAEPEEEPEVDETVKKLEEKGIGSRMKLEDALKSLLHPTTEEAEEDPDEDEEEEMPELEAAIEEIENVIDLELVNEITGKPEKEGIRFDSDLEELKAEPLEELPDEDEGVGSEPDETEALEDIPDEVLEEIEEAQGGIIGTSQDTQEAYEESEEEISEEDIAEAGVFSEEYLVEEEELPEEYLEEEELPEEYLEEAEELPEGEAEELADSEEADDYDEAEAYIEEYSEEEEELPDEEYTENIYPEEALSEEYLEDIEDLSEEDSEDIQEEVVYPEAEEELVEEDFEEGEELPEEEPYPEENEEFPEESAEEIEEVTDSLETDSEPVIASETETPEVPEMSEITEAPEMPETPEIPEVPEMAEALEGEEGIEEVETAENIKPESKKPAEEEQIEGQLSIEDIMNDLKNESAEEVDMGDNKKKAEPILPPDIQRMIDEIEGVLPTEPEEEPVRPIRRRGDERRDNMGAITQQLRIDDIADYLAATDDETYMDDLPEEIDADAYEDEYAEDYTGEYEDEYSGEEAADEYSDGYAKEEYADGYEDEYEEEEYADEYEDEYTEEEYADEYEDEYAEEEYADEYEDEYAEEEYTDEYEDEYAEEEYTDEYEDEYAEEEYTDDEYDAADGYEEDYGDIEASFEEEFRPNPKHANEPDDREIPDEDDGMDILSATTPLSRKETAKLIATGKTSPLPLDEISDALSLSDTGFVVHGRYDLAAQSGIGTRAGLTDEQKKLFSYFVPVRGMSEQLVDVLEQDRNCTNREGTSRTGNLLIIGNKGNGKTVLAVDVVKAIQKQRNIRQGKVAIVTGDSLNKKKIGDIFAKLYGGALIIEKASKMNEKTVARLNKAMERDTGEMLIVLEEQRKPLDRLLSSNREFRRKFTSRLEVPIFINDELVTFGQTYAQENGYRIDEMGILALYSKIDTLQREDHAVTVAEVKEVMDEAMAHSQKASAKKLVKRVFGKNTDDADRIILSEKDFNI